MKKDLSELQNNPASIERAAREKYLMKKDNEDLYDSKKNNFSKFF